MKYADGNNLIVPEDLSDCFKSLLDRHGMSWREEEIFILINHFHNDDKSSIGGININNIIEYCKTESIRSQWLVISKRLRTSVQKAYVSGVDIEQLLVEKDENGNHYINRKDFTQFLRNLSEYGKLSDTDIQSTVTHFCRKQSTESGSKVLTEMVSLKEFMSFLGKSYVGNLLARIKQKLVYTSLEKERSDNEILKIFKSNSSNSNGEDEDNNEVINIDELQNCFREFGVYTECSHEQIKPILKKICDGKNTVKYRKIFEFFGLNLPEELKKAKKKNTKADEKPLNAEELLRLLLNKVQKNGLAVDEAFRHFDCDGNGFITKTELEEGLSQLGIFDNIRNWRNEIPLMINKFDQTGTGNGKISLKDFFSFLGIKDYFPNIIQKMTKIFSLALEKGLTFQEIFTELDDDKDGKLDNIELKKSLLKLGTFGEISEEDSLLIIKQFGHTNDDTISLNEFIQFFSLRISTAANERLIKRQKYLINKFSDIIIKTKEKGVNPKEIFNHFDKNKNGSVSTEELSIGMRTLPHFESLSDNEIEGVVKALDSDKNGKISFTEFEHFIAKSAPAVVNEKYENENENDESNNSNESDDDKCIEKESNKENQKNNNAITKEKEKLKSIKDTLQQQIFKISKSEGGVDGYFANLDDDEDGLISVTSLLRSLERERVFNYVDKDAVVNMLREIERNGNLSVVALLNMFDSDHNHDDDNRNKRNDYDRNNDDDDYNYNNNYDRNGHNKNKTSNKTNNYNKNKMNKEDSKNNDNSDNENDNDNDHRNENENETQISPVEYDFSKDPETRSLEKKLRNLGRTLCKKGLDVEKMFLGIDVRQTGMIRRTEFVEIMSRLGLSILEKGKVFDDASKQIDILESSSGSGPVSSENRRLQLMQMKRLKGVEGGYANNANRAARSLVMGGGGGGEEGKDQGPGRGRGRGQGDFKVCTEVHVHPVCMYVRMHACLCAHVCMHICVFVYVCQCVSLYTSVYVCVFINVCVCVSLCMYVCMYICVCICVSLNMYVYMCVCRYVCMSVFVFIQIYTHVCVCICVCTYVCMCIHICLYVCLCLYVC